MKTCDVSNAVVPTIGRQRSAEITCGTFNLSSKPAVGFRGILSGAHRCAANTGANEEQIMRKWSLLQRDPIFYAARTPACATLPFGPSWILDESWASLVSGTPYLSSLFLTSTLITPVKLCGLLKKRATSGLNSFMMSTFR